MGYRFDTFRTYGMKTVRFGVLDELDFVNHCFTTKSGGVSKGVCESFNISEKRDSDKAAPAINLMRLAEYMGADYNKLTRISQVHGANVLKVDENNFGEGMDGKTREFEGDAMITDKKGVLLVTSHGDCLPIYLVDKEKKAIGMVHSGWRGTSLGIAGETVKKMKEAYGSNPSDIIAVIGPGIMKECFLSDEDVIRVFTERFRDVKYFDYDETLKKYNVSLPDYVKKSLMDAGVPESNIHESGICTCCEKNADIFFSHRRQKGKCGIMAAALMIKE